MTDKNIKELDGKYIAGTYHRYDAVIKSGKGAKLYDESGKEYIDFGSGIGVNAFGICDSVWQEAVIEQIKKIQHTSNYYFTEPCARLAELLCEKTGMKKVFFSNSGAEANECAIKAARKYGTDKNENKNKIITMKESFHGRTVTTLSATGQESFHKSFTPFTEGFIYAEPNDIDALYAAAGENVCAIMFEVVQGEGGVNNLSEEYLKAIEDVCKKNDILMVIDEVQTGNGRCGELYSYMHFGLSPDIVSTAKGLGGGLPIGATLFSEKTENVLSAGMHGSTFGDNPVSCAGAISIISRLTDDFLNGVKEKGEFIRAEIRKIKGAENISGLGLMIGFECGKDAAEVAEKCFEKGLLVLTAKNNKIRLLPPLNIEKEDIIKGLEILKGVIEA